MIFYNFTPCFEHFYIKLTNVSAFCTMSLLYVLLQLILRKLLVAAPPKTCHTPRAETPPSLIQPLAGLLPWLLCIIVVTRRQETGASRPPEAQIEKCWPAALLPWLLCIIVVTRRQETGTSRPPEAQIEKCWSAALLPWLLCTIVVTRRQETEPADQQRAKIENCWSVRLLPWLI